ncbi:hypothetical protein [Micromonospora polyrhachis]|uniref:Uncharacterized protein n=1 Tax=Micromonospora polyrhachis TaxID=1282883 RepID=A0A7W7WRI9_9ACTN|nr:hypothetical protein [Micromonospora polyrhachis]MBB4961145.1 hypothetical protein [Micromonospora polyrhachis]
MGGIDPGTAREEAERLVTTALAAVRLAAAGTAGGGSESGPSGPLGSLGSFGDMISGVLGPPPAGPPAAGAGASAGPEPSVEGDASETARAGAVPGGGHFATGTAECCVCPICRAIVALRDPSPEFSERLATGAGDFAAGVASLLRAFSTVTTTASASPTASDAGPEAAAGEPVRAAGPQHPSGPDTPAGTGAPCQTPAAGGEPGGDQMWREATRTGHDSWAAPEPDVWAAATRRDGAEPLGGSGAPTDAAATPDAAGTADVTGTADVAGPTARTRIRSAGTSATAHGAVDRPVVPASRTPTSGTGADDLSGDDA